MKVITAHIRAMALTTVPARTMEEAQSWSRLAIDHIIADPDIGMAACIMSGSPVTGHGGMASECGSVATMSREDTNPLLLVQRRYVSGNNKP